MTLDKAYFRILPLKVSTYILEQLTDQNNIIHVNNNKEKLN